MSGVATRCFLCAILLSSLFLTAGCGGKSSKEGSIEDELARAKKTTDPPLKVKRLVVVGAKQHEAGDPTGAKNSIELAHASCEDIDKLADRLKALNSVAEAYAQAGHKTDAEDILAKVKEEYLGIGAELSKVEVATKMAEVYGRHLGKKRAANRLLDEVESTADAIPDASYRVQAMADIAVAYYQFDAADNSASQLQKALEAARAIEDARKRTDALVATATCLVEVDRKDEAKQLLDEADKLTQSIEEPHSRAYALVSLARALGQTGDKPAAKEALERAGDLADEADSSLRGALKEKISATKKEL